MANRAADAGVQTHADPETEWRLFADRNANLIRFLTKRGFLYAGVDLLDFGSGSGHIPWAINQNIPSANILCIEADRDAGRYLKSSGLDVADSLSSLERVFDRVTLVEVIEHLSDPVSVLSEIRTHLRPDAQAFITTPCGETRHGSRATNAYDTPEHIQFFTERSLGVALNLAGFDRLDLQVINEMYPRQSGFLQERKADIKDAIRPLRARILGFYHLTGFCRAGQVR
jgi:SAM-dependent methyltransferase